MRKRFVFAALCILAVPPLFSPSQNTKLQSSAPFAIVALAGRTTYGGYCKCGCPGCKCDDGEESGPCLNTLSTISSDARESFSQVTAPLTGEPVSFDFGSGALFMALAFFAWARFRGTTF